MASKSNSSQPTQARAPHTPVKRLVEVPTAFYDIWELALAGRNDDIVPIIKSIIQVTQTEPAGLLRLPELARQLQAESLPCPAEVAR